MFSFSLRTMFETIRSQKSIMKAGLRYILETLRATSLREIPYLNILSSSNIFRNAFAEAFW